MSLSGSSSVVATWVGSQWQQQALFQKDLMIFSMTSFFTGIYSITVYLHVLGIKGCCDASVEEIWFPKIREWSSKIISMESWSSSTRFISPAFFNPKGEPPWVVRQRTFVLWDVLSLMIRTRMPKFVATPLFIPFTTLQT